MKLSMTYRVRTRGFNHIFDETVRLYRQALLLRGCLSYGMEPDIHRKVSEGTGKPGGITYCQDQAESSSAI